GRPGPRRVDAAAVRAGAGLHRGGPWPRAVPGRPVDGRVLPARRRRAPGPGPGVELRRPAARMARARGAVALGLAGGTGGDPPDGAGAAQRFALPVLRG